MGQGEEYAGRGAFGDYDERHQKVFPQAATVSSAIFVIFQRVTPTCLERMALGAFKLQRSSTFTRW